jgi:hypothetical protein
VDVDRVNGSGTVYQIVTGDEMTADRNLRDAMAIIKAKCWEVEENSEARQILGRVMAYLYYSVR